MGKQSRRPGGRAPSLAKGSWALLERRAGPPAPFGSAVRQFVSRANRWGREPVAGGRRPLDTCASLNVSRPLRRRLRPRSQAPTPDRFLRAPAECKQTYGSPRAWAKLVRQLRHDLAATQPWHMNSGSRACARARALGLARSRASQSEISVINIIITTTAPATRATTLAKWRK